MSATFTSLIATVQGYYNGTTPIPNLISMACDMKVINPLSVVTDGFMGLKTIETATEKTAARIPSIIHGISSLVLTLSTVDTSVSMYYGTYDTRRFMLDVLLIPVGLTETLFALHKGSKMRAAGYLFGVVVPSAISLWNNVTSAKVNIQLGNSHQVSLIYPRPS